MGSGPIFRSAKWGLTPFILCGAVASYAQPPTAAEAPLPVQARTAKRPLPDTLFRATSRHPFDDVRHWQRVFDNPKRDGWQRPAAVVEALELSPGMTVCDLGAGTGYFSRYLSSAVGPEGAVLAVETEPNLVGFLRERAEREGTANVTPVLASFDNPRLPRAACDVLLVVNTFHHLDDRSSYIGALADVLSPGGRLAIIEWQKRPLPVGPDMDHKLARTQVLEEMRLVGYELVAEPTVLPYQYFLVFEKKG